MRQEQLETRYGIQIAFDRPEFYTRPRVADETRWRAPPAERRLSVLEALDVDLSKYNPAVLKRYIDRICLFDRFEFRSFAYSGTYDYRKKWLYLDVHWLGDDGRHADAVGFHHEFSSVLLKAREGRFPVQAWRKLAPPSFRYMFEESSHRNLATDKQLTIGDFNTYEKGFVCEYGELTLEDDVNTYAQYLMAKPHMLLEIAATHPLVLKKAMLLDQFYSHLRARRTAQAISPFAALEARPRRPWEMKRDQLAARYRLVIVFDYPHFPFNWLSHDPQCTPIPREERMTSLETLEADLTKYEPEFLVKNLSRVCLCESLTFSDIVIDGSVDYLHKSLFIRGNWLGDAASARGFHSILAEMLLAAHKRVFPAAEWRRLNPKGFAYMVEKPSAGATSASSFSASRNTDSYANGFLSEHGQLRTETDIGSYAQYFVAKPIRLMQLAEEYPLVARKADLVSGFYAAIGFRRHPGVGLRTEDSSPPPPKTPKSGIAVGRKNKTTAGIQTFFGTLRVTEDGDFELTVVKNTNELVYALELDEKTSQQLMNNKKEAISAIVIGKLQDEEAPRPLLKVKSVILRPEAKSVRSDM